MVGEDKVRTLITIPKELKKELETLAKKDNRSTSNYIATILINHMDKIKSNKS